MAKNRLLYETIGGNLSSQDTYKQLLEYLTIAEEDARKLSNLCRRRNDLHTSGQWTVFANNFNKVRDIIIELATGKALSSVGYTGNG